MFSHSVSMSDRRSRSDLDHHGCCVILVIDDDAAMRSLLVDELSEFGCRVLQASDGIDAFAQLKASTPNLIVTDLNMKF